MRRRIAAICAAAVHTHALDTSAKLLRRVRKVDAGGEAYARARNFIVNGESLGRVLPKAAAALATTNAFRVTDDAVLLLDADPTAALEEAFQSLRDTVPMLRGWRDEAFAVRPSFASEPRAVVERAAAPLLGLPAYGIFVNGYVADAAGRPKEVWLGRRSPTKPTWPGLLDSLAAGGLKAGQLPREAMRAECREEAGVPDDVLEGLQPAGAVAYTGFHQDREWGCKPDTLFVFDLPVPDNWTPTPVDGEVESFLRVSVEELVDMLCLDDEKWKPNVGLVLTDFLVRHGVVDADDPGYLELCGALRAGRCA